MTRTSDDKEVSDRARQLIDDQVGDRGRFALLEEMSGINVGQWKNFYYKRQLINEKMLSFLVQKFPHDKIWLLTGNKAPEQSEYPFDAPIPKESDCQTVGQRLNWVIRECASPKGKMLFEYLQGRYKTISADEWAQVVLGVTEPTLNMVVAICRDQPHFIEWVLLGHAGATQVDPSNKMSVDAWKAKKDRDFQELAKSVALEFPPAAPTKNGHKKG